MGLRGRFVLALVAASALSMTAAVAALVPPLEHRLADDRLNALHELARSARPGLEDLRPEGRAAHALVRELARRTGGRVALVSPAGRVLVDSDPDARSLLPPLRAPGGEARSRVLGDD